MLFLIEPVIQAPKPKAKPLNKIKENEESPIPSQPPVQQSKPKGLTTQNTNKRSVNWSGGDFDPREFFVMWSYESPGSFSLYSFYFITSLYLRLFIKK